jgi:flagellar M-ring protein FliF
MNPDKVTVADSTGKLLSADGTAGGAAASSRNQYVSDYQDQIDTRLQQMLDRVLGPGNSTVQTTAVLNFDKAVTESKKYTASDPAGLALSASDNSEVYQGAAAGSAANGVVGPDGQMDTSTTTGTGGVTPKYTKKAKTSDNAIDTTVEHREAAPGSVESLHIGVVLDQTAAASSNPQAIEQMIRSAVGINNKRGDTLRVETLPFDRTTEKSAKAELAASAKAAATAQKTDLIRNGAIGLLVLLALGLAWLRARKRSKARQQATSYVVEQLRTDAARRDESALESPASAMLSLESARTPDDEIRDELAALVERQPEDVATLLRGWLVER